MGGDGMQGLAIAIFAAMAFMLAAGFAILFWVARAFARARSWDGATARRAGLIGGLVGLGLGALAVTATFFESSWRPPPRLELAVAPGYAQEWTFILEDPRAAATLDWRGSSLPFMQRHASLVVPRNGVVRVRSLGEALGRGDLDVRWSDGVGFSGSGGGPAPAGLGATVYLALNRQADPMRPSAMLPMGGELGELIRRREGNANLSR